MVNDGQQQKITHKSRKHTIQKKWLIVIGVVVVLLIAGGLGGWIYISNLRSSSISQSDKIKAEEAKRVAVLNKTVEKAQILEESGNQSEAIVVYNNAIKISDNNQDKGYLLLNIATVYYNDGKYDQALTFALESETYDKNSNIEKFIAMIYEAKNDNQKAIKYYQSAISLIDKTNPYWESNIKDYQNKIDFLNGITK